VERRIPVAVLYALFYAVLFCDLANGQNVSTAGYHLLRTNANLTETVLTPTTVQPSTFGKLFSLPVDGQIYAQPLYMQNVAVAGQGTHNVVFVETEHNSVYAFDADTAGPPLWTVNFGPSVPATYYDTADGPYTDIYPEIGITGTPVIDSSTGTLYVVAATMENKSFYHRLHALDITSGAERFGAPVVITARVKGTGEGSVAGIVSFDSLQHLQRPGLLLWNGVVYVAFGSHGDGAPWHGWMMAYSASNVQVQTAVFNSTSNGQGGAIWQSGRGPSVDAQGNIYVVTSNGDSDNITNFSDSVLKLDPSTLAITDWFAPSDQQVIDDDDEDLGSAGAILVPGTSLLITGGKQGTMYLLDTTSLGHLNATNSQIPQTFSIANFGIFNMALWNRSGGPLLYAVGAGTPFSAFLITGNQMSQPPVSQSSAAYAVPFQGMTISANGGQPGSGVLWVTTADSWPLPTTGTLHAFNADNLSSELWNSSMNPADALGGFSKFANPTVVNSKVYAPSTSNQLVVYGALAPPAVAITGLVNGASGAAGPVAPGEIVTISGQNFAAQPQVSFNNVPAPVLNATSNAITAIVPFEVAGSSQVTLQVNSATLTATLAATAPGIFPALTRNQDGTLNTAANPAMPESTVAVYGTGGGLTNPLDQTGSIAASANPLAATQSTTATVGGKPATVLFAGDVPGQVAGMVQFNIELPKDVAGTVPVIVSVGGVSSQSTAMVVVSGDRREPTSRSRRVSRIP
jgi:uncharacterized protein (TIGR03437 family)